MILDDVSITELSFGKEYTAAVEAKQVAQQEAQRAAFVVDRAIQEKQQKIVHAEGEAEAAKMISYFIQPLQLIFNIYLNLLVRAAFSDDMRQTTDSFNTPTVNLGDSRKNNSLSL